jgi:hypothetical protein
MLTKDDRDPCGPVREVLTDTWLGKETQGTVHGFCF